jgi:hypothetical protein
MAEKQTFNKVINVGTSKKGKPYFYIKTKAGKLVFVNLVANGRLLVPEISDGVKALEVEYTSYINDYDNDNQTLFNVTVVDELYNL